MFAATIGGQRQSWQPSSRSSATKGTATELDKQGPGVSDEVIWRMGVFRSKPYRAGRNEAQESEDEHAARRGVVTSMHDFQPVQSVAFVNGQEGRPTCVTGDSQGVSDVKEHICLPGL